MPQVPYNPVPTVQPTGTPDVYQRLQTDPDTFGAGIGRALESVGGALAIVAKRQEAMAKEQDGAYANEAFVKASVARGDIEAKYYTLEGRNAVSAYPSLVADMEKLRAESIAALPTDGAKKLFDQDFTRSTVFSIQSASRHAATENKKYVSGQSQARVDLAMQDSALRFADDEAFKNNLGVMYGEIKNQATLEGWSPEVETAKRQEAQSKAWTARIAASASHDPNSAFAMYEANKDSMTPSDQAAVETRIFNAMNQQGVGQIVDRVFAGDPVGAHDIIRGEEGYRSTAYWDVNAWRTGFGSDTITLADGSIHKVTSDTVVSRADAERDLNRRIGDFVGGAAVQVGQERWNSLGGNVKSALASVAYNYGSLPKSVVKAAQTGDTEAIATAVQSLSANPARRAREAAIIRGGAIKPVSTLNGEGGLADALAQGKQRAQFAAPGNAVFEDKVLTGIRTEWNLRASAVTDLQNAQYSQVQDAAIGDPKNPAGRPTTFDQLPKEVQDAYYGLDPDKRHSIDVQLESNANSPINVTPEILDHYHYVKGLETTDPAAWKAYDVARDSQLTTEMKKEIIKEQTAKPTGGAGDINLIQSLSVARGPLAAAGLIDQSNNADDPVKYNTFVGAFSAVLARFKTANGGKAPTDEQTLAIANDLLKKTPDDANGWTFGDTSTFKFESPVIDRGGDFATEFVPAPGVEIPQGARDVIVKRFIEKTGSAPSEDIILQIYTRSRVND